MVFQVRRITVAMGVLACFALAGPQAAKAEDEAGVRRLEIPSVERGGTLDVTVWYPASASGRSVLLGEDRIFTGTPALLDAPISKGRFPLVLLSHGAGLGGSAQAMSWIASPLARRGYVVAAPNHPGNSGPERSAEETMKLWLRPADLSQTVTALERAPLLSEHLDFRRIGVLGLSMGGSTALALAGARFDPQALATYCDTDAFIPSLCDWVRQSGVDLHGIDRQAAGRDKADARIRFAMAIDPAPVNAFRVETLSTIGIPVNIVNLGRAGHIPVAIDASAIADTIPDARYALIEDASHFSLFAECKPDGADIAAAEGIDEPVCRDGGVRSRKALHEQMIGLVADAFATALRLEP